MKRLGTTRLRILGMVLEGHRRGMPLTYQEMADVLGTYHGNVQQHIDALEKAGLIARDPFKARCLRPLVEFIPAEAR